MLSNALVLTHPNTFTLVVLVFLNAESILLPSSSIDQTSDILKFKHTVNGSRFVLLLFSSTTL